MRTFWNMKGIRQLKEFSHVPAVALTTKLWKP